MQTEYARQSSGNVTVGNIIRSLRRTGEIDWLDWFDEQATAAGITMNQAPLPATLAYRDLLARLDTEDYPTAVTALWVIEEVYLRAWTTAASDSSPYREFVEHWTDPGFATYVGALRDLAVPAAHEQVIAEVLSHEIAFWDMASTTI